MPIDTPLREYPFEDFRGELPGELLRMVADEPVARVRLRTGEPVWLVSGYDEVRTVLADPRFTRDLGHDGSGAGRSDVQFMARTLNTDGPSHLSLRRLASRGFTPRGIETFRPRIGEVAGELVAAMMAAGSPADLVSAFAAPLPMRVICEMLGVPIEDRERFRAWSEPLVTFTAHTADEVARAGAALSAYLTDQIAAKRRNPGQDLLSAWIAAQEGNDELSETEILCLALAVLVAGHESTVHMISASVRTLFRHPGQLARLRADPALLPRAVEECVRYTTFTSVFRQHVATEDVELGGMTIRAADAVMAMPAAANHDPRIFTEPDVFDIGRVDNPHLGFGYGPHFCLGAALARVELQVALGTLLDSFPGLRPAVSLDRLRWRNDLTVGGLVEFPVTW